MNTNYIELKELARKARRALEQERDDIQSLAQKVEQMDTFLQVLNARDGLLTEYERLQEEADSLRAQLQEKEVQLSEQRKLTTGMAKKSSEDELIKAIRVFINISKRKSLDKRTHIKDMIRDLADAVKLELPDDLRETLAHLDDEQNEPSQQVFIETLNGTATGQVTQNIGQSEQAKLLVKS